MPGVSISLFEERDDAILLAIFWYRGLWKRLKVSKSKDGKFLNLLKL